MQPIPERMEEVRRLTQEYGAPEAIPEDALTALDYTRFSQEDGIVQLIPSEVFAMRAVKRAAEFRQVPEEPFDTLELVVETSGGYGTALTVNQMRQENFKTFAPFKEKYPARPYHNETITWLPKDHPIHDIVEESPNFMQVVRHGGSRWFVYQENAESALTSYGIEVARQIHAETETPTIYYDDITDYITTYLNDALARSDRLDSSEAEELWLHLEKVKSRLSDEAEVEKYLLNRWSSSRIENAESELGVEDPEDGSTWNNLPEIDISSGIASEDDVLDAAPSMNVRFRSFAEILALKGFSDVAEQLITATTLEEGRTILVESIRNNSVARSYKAQEKELTKTRRDMTNQEDINEFNVKLHALRDAAKLDMRILRGAQAYFDIPKLYAQTVKRAIKDLQSKLVVPIENKGMGITLDPKFDEVKDRDPGVLSGDCTTGNPLPFGTHIPVFNVKIETGGNHVGNIYLLKTTSNGEPVWHLDAVQYPSFVVDWQKFPQTLMEALIPEAEKNGVSMITVNKQAYLISNYDYIARGFLQYAGVTDTNFTYGSMELDIHGETPDYHEVEEIEVDFPAAIPDRSQFQGAGEAQIALWKKKK